MGTNSFSNTQICAKIGRRQKMGRAEDRISSLPDELLQSILCMMPLKSAIRTSILSRRWTHLWKYSLTSATALEFGDDFACNQSPVQLVATLNRYLRLHGDTAIDRFRVVFCPFDVFARDIEGWVRTAIGKGLKELELDLSQGIIDTDRGMFVDGRVPLELPNYLFHCRNSLTRLSLSRCNLADPLGSSVFAGLLSLSLNHVGVTDDAIQDFLSNCPLLEFLSLRSCHFLASVKVMGPPGLRLRSLELIECWGVYELEVSAPTLRSFAFHGRLCSSNNFVDVSAMEDAYISLIGTEDFNWEDEYIRLLSGVAHVKILTLCSVGLMHIVAEEEYNNEEFPIELQNLQELQLLMDSMSDEHLTCIFTFFLLCVPPFLERLFIRLPNELEDPIDISDTVVATRDTPDIVFGHLKFIKVVNFRGTRCELRFVKFLLEKAAVLESLILVTPGQYENVRGEQNERLYLKILRGQLSMLQKASSEARVVVCQPQEDSSLDPARMSFYHVEKYLCGAVSSLGPAPVMGAQNVLLYP